MISRANERACVVCGHADARGLLAIDLEDGARVTVCGSHELAHRRAGRMAKDVADLRTMTVDRREPRERRFASGTDDELATRLFTAFAPERRAGDERRGR